MNEKLKTMADHNHVDILNGAGAGGAGIAAFGVFMLAAILESAWGADRLKAETLLAFGFALPFWFGIRQGSMERAEWMVKRSIAVASSVVTIYAAAGGMQGFVASQKMQVVGAN